MKRMKRKKIIKKLQELGFDITQEFGQDLGGSLTLNGNVVLSGSKGLFTMPVTLEDIEQAIKEQAK